MYQQEVQNQIRRQYSQHQRTLEPKGFFQALFFTWIVPVISYGNKVLIDEPAVPQMAKGQHASDEFHTLLKQIQQHTHGNLGLRLMKSIIKAFKKTLVMIFITAAIATTISMLLPILTKRIINYVESGEQNRSIEQSLILIGIVLAFKFIGNLSISHMFYHFTMLGYNVNNGLSLCVFNKALSFPTLCSKAFSLSQLINYSQVDAQRMTYLASYTSGVLFFPIQLTVGVYLMYSFMGVSFLAGIGIILLMGVFIYVNSRLNAKANERLLLAKDKRMKVATEIFDQIRFIKVNAWEKYFFNRLDKARTEELKQIKKVGFFGVLAIFFFCVSTPLILSATFGVYIWISTQAMTAQKAFTTIILFNILQFPLRALPESITQLTQIWVSLKRIGTFLYNQQIDKYYITDKTGNQQNAIEIRDGNFYWDLEAKDKDKDRKDKLKKKDSNSTTGTNRTPKKRGSHEGLDAGSQSDSGSMVSPSEGESSESDIKQSLLDSTFQEPLVRPPHKKAIKRVYLDIKKGKFTMVLGDIGSGKSSLIYAILGEMKPQPGHSPNIAIAGSVALTAQKAWILSSSVEDNILMTAAKDEAKFANAVKFSCLEDDLRSFPDGLQTMLGEKGVTLSGGQKARIGLARALYANRDIYLFDDLLSAVDAHVANNIVRETLLGYLHGRTRVLVTHAIHFAKFADHIIVMKRGEIVEQGSYEQVRSSRYFKQIEQIQQKHAPNPQTEFQTQTIKKQIKAKSRRVSLDQTVKITDKLVQQLMLPQDRQRGKVTWQTYKIYIALNGGKIFFATLMLNMVCWLALSTLANIQIQRWCEDPNNGYYDLWLFAGLSIGSAFFALARALTLVLSGIKQGTVAHKRMVKGLLYASIPEFYDRVPIGRILNRVSKDLRELDETIGFSVGSLLVNLFLLIGNLSICVYASTPFILIPVALFLLICNKLKTYYMNSQRQCVRLQTISNSPIVSSFSSTVSGLPTIRTYGATSQFLLRQLQLVNTNKRIRLTRQAMQSWFSQRLSWLSFFINISAISYCILNGSVSGSMAGLLLAYSFTIDENVINLTYSLATLENKMVSVERVAKFMDIEPETGYVDYVKKWSPEDQPVIPVIEKGELQFDKLTICYRPGLPPVLRDLCFNVQAGQKIGIVGRTGAGKSTIVGSILRLVEAAAGAVLVDGKRTSELSVRDLRSSITLIAQQPVLIEGTLRQNLDPRVEHADARLFEALQKCGVDAAFAERDGLNTPISAAGVNLSVGEKQLVCIARALLRDSRLVLVDEATANIDTRTDQLIQQALRDCFQSATVLTIAHRLHTVMSCDRIAVLAEGRLVEFDTPQRLLQAQGLFYSLYQQSKAQEAV